MPRLPPVAMSRHTRLRARFWPGVGISVLTFFQSHSSSSATSWARPGQRALAHLRAGDADDDIVVRADEHPGADLVAISAQHLLRRRAAEPRQMQAERETTANGRPGDEHLAS